MSGLFFLAGLFFFLVFLVCIKKALYVRESDKLLEVSAKSLPAIAPPLEVGAVPPDIEVFFDLSNPPETTLKKFYVMQEEQAKAVCIVWSANAKTAHNLALFKLKKDFEGCKVVKA